MWDFLFTTFELITFISIDTIILYLFWILYEDYSCVTFLRKQNIVFDETKYATPIHRV